MVTMMVKVTLLETNGLLLDTVLDRDRSAKETFVVTADAALLAGLKSVTAEETFAVLVNVPLVTAVAVMVNVAVALLEIVPRLPVTSPFVWVKPP